MAVTAVRASTGQPSGAVSPEREVRLARRVRWLIRASISYNVIEAVVAVAAGVVASSTALIGFGLDSVIEVSSAVAVAWQFTARDRATLQAREERTLRTIAVSFFALAAYLSLESLRSLVGGGVAEHSTVGVVLAALSLAVMPVLSYAQRSAGRQLGSATAVADAKQTLLCSYMSAVLLVGLGLNSLFGWSWADPLAALVIAGVAVTEGVNAWRGDACCPAPRSTPASSLDPAAVPADRECESGTDCCSATNR